MRNIEILFNNVEEVNHDGFNDSIFYIKTRFLKGKEIYRLLGYIKWVNHHFPSKEFSIYVKSDKIASADVVSTIEIIMCYLASFYPNLWKICFTSKLLLERNVLFHNSLAYEQNGKRIGEGYLKKFSKKTIGLNHFRALISLDEFLQDNKSISAYCDDIFSFLKHTELDEDSCADLFDACSEVISNVFDHTESDCLVDIKCSSVIGGRKLFTFTIISISTIFIGSKIVELIDNGQISNYSGSAIVLKAYKYHSRCFSTDYDKNSFGFVCAFQNRVSTRVNSKESGGTGLTTLLKRIHGKKTEDSYHSYVLSGDNMLLLNTQYLNVDSEGLIGFNDSNDFYNDTPNRAIVVKEQNVFPGTIFSVSLLL